MNICHVCGNTGIEHFDDTDARGYLCTSSRPCPRCARHRRRRERVINVLWALAGLTALVLGLLPALAEVLR